jgi:hypothetical protein
MSPGGRVCVDPLAFRLRLWPLGWLRKIDTSGAERQDKTRKVARSFSSHDHAGGTERTA